MKVWFLIDGISKVSDDPSEVVAIGPASFFIYKSEGVLMAVPKDIVTAKLYANSEDNPPSIFEYLGKHADEVQDIDFSLSNLFKTIH